MGKLAYSFGVSMSSQGAQPYLALSNKDIVLTESKDVPHLCQLEHLSYEPHSINNQKLVCRNESEFCGLHGNGHCFIQVCGKV